MGLFSKFKICKGKVDNMDEESKALELRDEFFEQYEKKYQLVDEKPMGKGHYACVFKARDLDRTIDVAIKIFFDGIPPAGSQRGWHLTSSIIHNQIAPTSTVETFYSKSLKCECKAVVQRFIPGKTLKKILDKFDGLEHNENYQHVLNDFGLSYFSSLLNILNFCHSQGFGHGDCHDGNIMIFSEIHPTKHNFRVVLIDFDNASFKEKLSGKTEKEKIQNDIGLLKYFYKKTFIDWKYYKPVLEMLDNYDTLAEYQFSYGIISELILKSIKRQVDNTTLLQILSKFPHPMMGFHIPPTIACLRTVAEIGDFNQEFESALKEYFSKASNPENWNHSLEIEIIEGGTTNIYKDMFDAD